MSLLFPQLPDGPVADFDPELLEASIETLRAVVGGDDLARRLPAAALLAAHGDDTGRAILHEGVKDDASTYVALEALRWLDDREALPWARDILGRQLVSRFAQAQAAALLVSADEAEGRAYLLERLQNRKRDDDRGLVVELCGELGLQAALPELRTIAARPDDIFRGAALKALSHLEANAIRATLEGFARDETADTDLRCEAVEALAIIGDTEALSVLAEIAGGEGIVADLARDLAEV